ncbi:hypothetical protein PtrM4_123260 [Pyrenophora tritici-repentis]|uniref:DDE-1 domain-containing protein n=2 Tax=Pyrenophora tritici-repentis TaxID=45151 RepID=A0A834RU73_9PLEO|nr:hypothetical protein PtrM4_123260 [Pyrenophora tritici-repentis]
MDFINFCNDNKILLAVFPPHATHTLQPLDVSLFKPLSDAYLNELTKYLQDSQGLLSIVKGDFFHLFWNAWCTAFRPQTITKSFEAIGIHPPNAEVILKRFAKAGYNSDESSSSCLSGDDWLKLESIIRRTVKDQSNKDVKKLRRSLHHISAQASLLRGEVKGLRAAMGIKKRREKKSYTLQLNKPHEYHGGAVFWSPKKVRQARDDEAARQQQQQLEKAQKAEARYLKEQSRLYKLQEAEQKHVEKERLKEVREKERAAEKAEKERRKAARDSQKAIQQPQNGKRKASQSSTQKQKRQKGVGDGAPRVQAEVATSIIPTQTTRQGRTTKVPSKYK